MIYPIAIASKARPNAKIFQRLEDEKLPYRIFVEPQEREAYKQWSTHQLDANDRGLAFARNAILNYSRKERAEKFWMLDDDIEKFHIADETGFHVVSIKEALTEAEKALGDVAQGALEYSQFAWSAQNGEVSKGGYCDVCVLIDVPRTQGLHFREEVALKLDRDFTLQVIAKGLTVKRASYVAFSCPENGSNRGGLYEAYKSGREKADCEALAKLWPQCVTVHQKKSGRWDAKIDWRNVMQNAFTFE